MARKIPVATIWAVRARNAARMLITMVLLTLVFLLLKILLPLSFPRAEATSFARFQASLFIGFLLVMALELFWWLSALGLTPMREHIEQYSYRWAFGLCAIALVMETSCFLLAPTLINGQYPYLVPCVFMFCTVFTGCMYMLPPVNLNRVILPMKWCGLGRAILSVLMLALTVLIFALCFIGG